VRTRSAQSTTGSGAATPERPKLLYLCAGLQSSGSTLASWCFLQRCDMDGILDGRGDILPAIPSSLAAPRVWCKFTITAFRLRDMVLRYQADGWQIRPVLVVRDVRSVYNSLVTKAYGSNGVTAEEPPLRLRFVRFKEDWQLARAAGWPIIRYESLLREPQRTLAKACARLDLAWDPAMLAWPKSPQQIAFPGNGNATFQKTRATSFRATVQPNLATLAVKRIPAADLAWLEQEFAAYNAELGYPLAAASAGAGTIDAAVAPQLEATRRYRRLCRRLRRSRRLGWLTRFIPSLRRKAEKLYLESIGVL
jgi:hypothetical protein